MSTWEVLTDYRVDCVLDGEHLEGVKQYLGKRVGVTGRIRYRHGKPLSIQVTAIREFKDRHELPQPSDLGKLDITGGKSSEEFVRDLRDGE